VAWRPARKKSLTAKPTLGREREYEVNTRGSLARMKRARAFKGGKNIDNREKISKEKKEFIFRKKGEK